MQGRMMFIHGLSPIHTGTGQSVDVIDLPIAREKTTGWPVVPGSSIKGVLRDACDDKSNLFKAVFGPDTNNADESAGSVIFCDSHILCLPVRSFYGTFAWVTCPGALQRINRDYKAGDLVEPFKSIPEIKDFDQALVAADNVIAPPNKVYLEDYDLNVKADTNTKSIAEYIAKVVFPGNLADFVNRFAIVGNNMFSVLTETATEVVARIKINDDSKTATKGGLRYEEAVPAESIFWLPLLATPRNDYSATDLFGFLDGKYAKFAYTQIGGHASVGKGLVHLVFDGGTK